MTDEHHCDACSASGCTARHTDEQTSEEIGAGYYLIMAALIMVAASLLVKWLW